MFRKLISILMVLSVFSLIGCSSSDCSVPVTTITQESQTQETEKILMTDPTEIVPTTMDETQISTAPDVSLDAESGAYQLSYVDPVTNEYMDYYLYIPENAQINMPIVYFSMVRLKSDVLICF